MLIRLRPWILMIAGLLLTVMVSFNAMTLDPSMEPAPSLKLIEDHPHKYTVDGNLNEWNMPPSIILDKKNQVIGKERIKDYSDYRATVWVSIDNQGLLIAGTVQDSSVLFPENDKDLLHSDHFYFPGNTIQTVFAFTNRALGYQYEPEEPSPAVVKMEFSQNPIMVYKDIELYLMPWEVLSDRIIYNLITVKNHAIISSYEFHGRYPYFSINPANPSFPKPKIIYRQANLVHLLFIADGARTILGTGQGGADPAKIFEIVELDSKGNMKYLFDDDISSTTGVDLQVHPQSEKYILSVLQEEYKYDETYKDNGKYYLLRFTRKYYWDQEAGVYHCDKINEEITGSTYKAVPQKGTPVVTFSNGKDLLVVDIHSPTGIGSASIEKTTGQWPSTVVMNLHVKGLENFKFHFAGTTIEVCVSSHGDNLVQETYEKTDSRGALKKGDPDWISVTPIQSYFFIRAPAAFLQSGQNQFTIEWIDFYR